MSILRLSLLGSASSTLLITIAILCLPPSPAIAQSRVSGGFTLEPARITQLLEFETTRKPLAAPVFCALDLSGLRPTYLDDLWQGRGIVGYRNFYDGGRYRCRTYKAKMYHILLEFPTEEIIQELRMRGASDFRVRAASMFLDERRVHNSGPNQCSQRVDTPIHRIMVLRNNVGIPSYRSSPATPLSVYNSYLTGFHSEAVPDNVYIQNANYIPSGNPPLKPGYIWSDDGWVTYGDFMRTMFGSNPEQMILYRRKASGTRGMVWSPDRESDHRTIEYSIRAGSINVALISVDNQHRVSTIPCRYSYGNFKLLLRVDYVPR
jgi:hypothetical protein